MVPNNPSLVLPLMGIYSLIIDQLKYLQSNIVGFISIGLRSIDME